MYLIAMRFFLLGLLATVAIIALLFACNRQHTDAENIKSWRIEEARSWVKLHEARLRSSKMDCEITAAELNYAKLDLDRLLGASDGAVATKIIKEAEYRVQRALLTCRDCENDLAEAEAELDIARIRFELAEEGSYSLLLPSIQHHQEAK